MYVASSPRGGGRLSQRHRGGILLQVAIDIVGQRFDVLDGIQGIAMPQQPSLPLFQVNETHEAELVSAPTSIAPYEPTEPHNTPPDGPLFVGVGDGYVRGREQDGFEVIAGKSLVSFHRVGPTPDSVRTLFRLRPNCRRQTSCPARRYAA
jgi:hypothetical protein